MKAKKLMALLIAGAIMLSMGTITAFATPGTVTGDGDTVFVDTEVIEVLLPTNDAWDFVLDPQGLLALEDGADASAADLFAEAGRIWARPYAPTVINRSSRDIVVTAAINGTGDATFVSTVDAVEANTTTNVLLAIVPSTDSVDDPDAEFVEAVAGTPGTPASGTEAFALAGTATNFTFYLDAAAYVFTNTGGTYAYERDDDGFGTQLQIAGLVNRTADWADFVTISDPAAADAAWDAHLAGTSWDAILGSDADDAALAGALAATTTDPADGAEGTLVFTTAATLVGDGGDIDGVTGVGTGGGTSDRNAYNNAFTDYVAVLRAAFIADSVNRDAAKADWISANMSGGNTIGINAVFSFAVQPTTAGNKATVIDTNDIANAFGMFGAQTAVADNAGGRGVVVKIASGVNLVGPPAFLADLVTITPAMATGPVNVSIILPDGETTVGGRLAIQVGATWYFLDATTFSGNTATMNVDDLSVWIGFPNTPTTPYTLAFLPAGGGGSDWITTDIVFTT